MLRLIQDEERLGFFNLAFMSGLDKQIDKSLFDRVTNKIDYFFLGAMPGLKGDVR